MTLLGGDVLAEMVALRVGFIGLVLCAVIAIVIVLLQWGGRLSGSACTVGKVVGVLMLIGGTVPAYLTLLGVSRDEAAVGPGMAFFYAGAIGFLYLMSSEVVDGFRSS